MIKNGKYFFFFFPFVVLFVFFAASLQAQPSKESSTEGYSWNERGEPEIHVHFFWSITCPHCEKAKPFVEKIKSDYPWIRLHSHELSQQSENRNLFAQMTESLGQKAVGVPAFLFCGQIHAGYLNDETTGETLRRHLLDCYASVSKQKPQEDSLSSRGEDALALPWGKEVRPESLSLPLLTLVVAGMDAFNPCAFFVLHFLLSLLIHAQSRLRIFVVGVIFVFFSGFIYFLFMAAWLNFFLVMGTQPLATWLAGIAAVVISFINIKDYFWFKKGVSLTIPEQAKPDLYQRVRKLVYASNWPLMIIATVTLAVAANTYELLCTAGFPMIFTRILTLREVAAGTYYMYLLFYNLVYVLPLFVIVVVFTMTLGSRKLTEEQGKVLKLLSGLMMLGLGLILLLAPGLLNNVLTGVAVLVSSAGLTAVAVGLRRLRQGPGI